MRILSGSLRQREIVIPKNSSIRPTSAKVRLQVFNICQGLVEGARVLDLFAGSGAIGFEALSRGADHCTFVENDRKAVAVLRSNIQRLGLENTYIFAMDVMRAINRLSRISKPFSVVYIDPPYQSVSLPDILFAIDSLLPLCKGAFVFVETRKSTGTPPSLSTLSFTSCRKTGDTEIWVFEKD